MCVFVCGFYAFVKIKRESVRSSCAYVLCMPSYPLQKQHFHRPFLILHSKGALFFRLRLLFLVSLQSQRVLFQLFIFLFVKSFPFSHSVGNREKFMDTEECTNRIHWAYQYISVHLDNRNRRGTTKKPHTVRWLDSPVFWKITTHSIFITNEHFPSFDLLDVLQFMLKIVPPHVCRYFYSGIRVLQFMKQWHVYPSLEHSFWCWDAPIYAQQWRVLLVRDIRLWNSDVFFCEHLWLMKTFENRKNLCLFKNVCLIKISTNTEITC